MLRFSFDPRGREPYGFSQYGIISDNRMILLDAGYQDQMAETVQWCSVQGITLELLLISHFHRDHYDGASLAGGADIGGSRHYQETIRRFSRNGTAFPWSVTRTFKTGDRIPFGNHEIQIFEAPGHSSCSLITCIDSKYYHVGDLVILDQNQKPLMPLIQRSGLEDHIASLEFLRVQAIKGLLPGHGAPLFQGEAIQQDLETRLTYLKALKNAPAKLLKEPEDEHWKPVLEPFSNGHWHGYNCRAVEKPSHT